MLSQVRAFLIFAAAAGIAVYALLCAWLYLDQESFIFFRVKNDPDLVQRYEHARLEMGVHDAAIETWIIENPEPDTQFTVIYFGGNAEDVLRFGSDLKRIGARRIVLVNYRGYGRSTGKPSEQALCSDALAVHDAIVDRFKLHSNDVVVAGRSLGSGVATYLAAHRTVHAAILVTPYDSIRALAQRDFPWMPVGLLLKHPFDSVRLASKLNVPALFIVAEQDSLIPPVHAERLKQAWRGNTHWTLLEQVGHNDIQTHLRYFDVWRTFLRELQDNPGGNRESR